MLKKRLEKIERKIIETRCNFKVELEGEYILK